MIRSIINRIKEKRRLNISRSIIKSGDKEKADLLIIDKFFPDTSYPWRTLEFNSLLTKFQKSRILCEASNYKGITSKEEFEKQIETLFQYYKPTYSKNKLEYSNANIWEYNLNSKLVYFLFYEDAVRFFPYLRYNNIEFAFTLYPGGGFLLYNEQVDQNLKAIIQCDLCKVCFVNMPSTYKYLTQHLNLNNNKIKLVYGVPLDIKEEIARKKDSSNKMTIGFCARKYHKRGIDKGFDIFIEIANHYKTNQNIQFVCIGDFSTDDLYENEKDINIDFKGLLASNQLENEFRSWDIIISPVRAYTNQGDFDGFPTAAGVEASLH
ncbi:MAG: hypothetical protein C0594_04565, partial [Marinilabiliales bacterium]